MSTTLKRKHHYVWRNYLKAWTTNSQIWCMRGTDIFQSELMGVAQKRDFYKIRHLEQRDVQFLLSMISQMDRQVQINSKHWVQFFKIISSIGKHKALGNTSKLEKLIKEVLHNTEEDLYADIETRAIPLIKLLLNHDFSFLKTKNGRLDFLDYVCNQYFRTRNLQQRTTRYVRVPSVLGDPNLENCWPILRHIFSDNMTLGLASDSSLHICALHNESAIPFLSGDQPVINTMTIGKPDDAPVNDVELYYPISPKLAIIISNDVKRSDTASLNDKEADFYNKAIIEASADQVYSRDRSTLSLYC